MSDKIYDTTSTRVDEIMMKLIGFHGTSTKYQKSIEKNGLDPAKTTYRSDHWLGQGVYFFTEFEKALWWAKDQVSKQKRAYSIVYKSNIISDDENVLELTTIEDVDLFFDSLIEIIDDSKDLNITIDSKEQGRAIFFDVIKEKLNIYVIIAMFPKLWAGYTANRSKKQLQIQKNLSDITHITYLEKQVCVSKKTCIQNTVIEYNESEEVL